ncbi:hypothetical protein [Lentibacillus sp. CBA3610]|uniref:hypothetical protein n=1 Tax=Lentibacillus sp. CBA3610 TaxID=2518176 RepID=UPI001595DC81|nr:hypothetical protein [Lentibacillus sp. CBA3610]QKY70141.1 hypothetical protein Len3610_11565 [Lentibacillus sp. CBA3610]
MITPAGKRSGKTPQKKSELLFFEEAPAGKRSGKTPQKKSELLFFEEAELGARGKRSVFPQRSLKFIITTSLSIIDFGEEPKKTSSNLLLLTHLLKRNLRPVACGIDRLISLTTFKKATITVHQGMIAFKKFSTIYDGFREVKILLSGLPHQNFKYDMIVKTIQGVSSIANSSPSSSVYDHT